MPINTEKITKEIDKGTLEEAVQAYYQVKEYVATLVQIAQKEADEKSTQLQNTYDRIKGIS